MNSELVTSPINSSLGKELTLEEIDEITGVKYDDNIENDRLGPELTWIEILELVKPPTKNYVGWWTNDRLRQIQKHVESFRTWTVIDGKIFTISHRDDGRFFVKCTFKWAGPCALLYYTVFSHLPENEEENGSNATDGTESNSEG